MSELDIIWQVPAILKATSQSTWGVSGIQTCNPLILETVSWQYRRTKLGTCQHANYNAGCS